jgi:hypothetical protein
MQPFEGLMNTCFAPCVYKCDDSSKLTALKSRQRLKEIFKWMDKDGTGQVEQKELHGALRRLGGNIKESEVDQLLASMDADGDGQVRPCSSAGVSRVWLR